MKKIVSIIAALALTCSIAGCTRAGGQKDGNNYGIQQGTDQYGTNQGNTAGMDQNGANLGNTTGINQTGVNPNNASINPGGDFIDNRTGYNTGTQSGLNGLYNGTGTNLGYQGNNQGNQGNNQGNAQGNAQGYVTGIYKDGTFTGEGDKNSRATVTITGGRITDIVFAKADENGTLSQDENLNLGTQPGGGATSNVGQTPRTLTNAMIQAQSPDIVTSTTGDTTVVDDMKLAVRRALLNAAR
jgi:major membrane immunogen (membrane-anchored lipoprotein)